MNRFLARWLINTLALWAAALLIPGIHFDNGISLIIVALIFGFVNAIIRPIAKILTFPLIVLTLGLFTLVVNALMLLLAARIAASFGAQFYVSGLWAAFWGAIVVSFVSIVLSIFLPE